MDFLIYIDTISLIQYCPLCTLRGHSQNFLNYDLFLSLKNVLILANSAVGWLVDFVALRPKSTAMVIAGRSVHLTTLFPGQA